MSRSCDRAPEPPRLIVAVIRIDGKVVARVSPEALKDASDCPIHALHHETCCACAIAREAREAIKEPAHT